MLLRQFFIIIPFTLADAKTEFQSKVVEGAPALISSHAHSVFLTITDYSGSFVCGSSVINQKILLTAAHCIDSCNVKCWDATAYAGSANKRRGHRIPILKTLSHPDFDRHRIKNDIGLVLLHYSLPLGNHIKRVAIMRNSPPVKTAVVAGWGLINEVQTIYTDQLHFLEQTVWTADECQDLIYSVPEGTICAGDIDNRRYASEGDSGSALMANGYIEIGLVSFKRPDISRGVVVYTDVSYFYDWIKKNSRMLYCEYN